MLKVRREKGRLRQVTKGGTKAKGKTIEVRREKRSAQIGERLLKRQPINIYQRTGMNSNRGIKGCHSLEKRVCNRV